MKRQVLSLFKSSGSQSENPNNVYQNISDLLNKYPRIDYKLQNSLMTNEYVESLNAHLDYW